MNYIHKSLDINTLIGLWISRILILIIIVFSLIHINENVAGISVILFLLLGALFFISEHQIILFEESILIKKKYLFNLVVIKKTFYYREIEDFELDDDNYHEEYTSGNHSISSRNIKIHKRNNELFHTKVLICRTELEKVKKIVKKQIEKYSHSY